METIVGLMFWGGLLVLAFRWVLRSYRGPSPGPPVTPMPPAAPPPRPLTTQPAVDESARESGALVDGLIIGHHLTRTHYQDRLAEQAETIDTLRADAASDTYLGGDDLEDPDALAAMDGYGPGGDADGANDAGSDELDELDTADDPWDEDGFGYDEGDDY